MSEKNFVNVRAGYKGRITILQSKVQHANEESIKAILHEVLTTQEKIKHLDEEILFTFDNEKDVTNEIGKSIQYHDNVNALIDDLKSRLPSGENF